MTDTESAPHTLSHWGAKGCQLWRFERKLTMFSRHRIVYGSDRKGQKPPISWRNLYKTICTTNICLFSGIFCAYPWWHHQMETYSSLLALCAGNSPVTGEFPSQRLVTQSFDVFFDLRLNKWLSKQSRRRWFEMPSCSLWRHCNVNKYILFRKQISVTLKNPSGYDLIIHRAVIVLMYISTTATYCHHLQLI